MTNKELVHYILNFGVGIELPMEAIWALVEEFGVSDELVELKSTDYGLPHDLPVFKLSVGSGEATQVLTVYLPFAPATSILLPTVHPSGKTWEEVWLGKHRSLQKLR